MSSFDSDKRELVDDLARSRAELVAVVEALRREDFELARRGSWTVARILEHVRHSERLYTQLISVFSSKPVTPPETGELADAGAALSALSASRDAFLKAVAEVDEDDFYRLQTIGHEEYSVLSILENNAAHDREHAQQIRKTVES